MFPFTTRILVVDDMVAMRQLIKNQLRGLGYKTLCEADNGETALQVLARQREANEPIELVLSDWNMPTLGGLDLLKKVRASEHFKHLPFMLVTAEGEQAQVVDAIRSGVSNYLVKPFTPAAFQEKLAAVWKKHNPGG